MKRKFLKAVLFTVAMATVSGTFVSCKDYDDDIKDLQEQINQKALAADVTALQSQVQSALSAAQSALAEAQKKADATAVADLEKRVAALESAMAKLEEFKADLEKKNKEDFEKLKAEVEATIGNMSTEVTLMGVFATDNWGKLTLDEESNELTLKHGVVANPAKAGATFTFGKADQEKNGQGQPVGTKYAATPTADYVGKAAINFPGTILVRVNPANAELTPDMIKLVNSKGEDLSAVVACSAVNKYDALLTRAGESGLWAVSFQLKSDAKVKDNQIAGLIKDGKSIRCYVALNNTENEDRYVVSDEDITFTDLEAYVPAEDLSQVKVITKVTNEVLANINESPTDGASTGDVLAENGETITISFENLPQVDKFYVVRDDDHAGKDASSQASEINAWNTYKYEGLNKMVEVANGTGKGKVTVTIPGAVGDEVAFRIFAVNYDGTVLDRSFVAYVGKNTAAASVTANMKADKTRADVDGVMTNNFSTGWVAIDGTLKDGVAFNPATVDLKAGKDVVIAGATIAFAKNAKGEAASKNSEIKYVKIDVPAANVADWKDGATLTSQLTTNGADGLIENTFDVTLTKVMPDAAYTKTLLGYSWKAEQLKNGVYTAYLYPQAAPTYDWTTTVTAGYKTMASAINGLDDGTIITIADAALTAADWQGKQYYKNPIVVEFADGATFPIEVNNAEDSAGTLLIDSKTQHDMAIGYNYGFISSETEDDEVYVVNVEEDKIVFACPLDPSAHTYAWTKIPEVPATATTPAVPAKDVNFLTYGSTATVDGVNLAEYILGKNSYDNSVFGMTLANAMVTSTGLYVEAVKAELISNATGKPDYYTVAIDQTGAMTFTLNSETTNPLADVPSTLKITLKDCFGHENAYELPFTVKRAE